MSKLEYEFDWCEPNGLGWCKSPWHVGRQFSRCVSAYMMQLKERHREECVAQFAADAQALINSGSRDEHPVSEVYQTAARCVGAQYNVCARHPERPWVVDPIYRLVDIENKEFPFYLCPSCARLLQSRGVSVERFSLSDHVRAAS